MEGFNHDNAIVMDHALLSEPDDVIVNLVREGDILSYEVIMRRYNQRLFRTARSILNNDDDAQDAVQEAYIAAFYKLDSYESSGRLGAWLTRITVNEALMIKRKPDNRVVDQSSSEMLSNPQGSPDDAAANRQLSVLIESAIDTLPDNFRRVFMLRAVQQLSVRETADSLDIKEATVKTRYLRARQQMQTVLNKHIEDVGLHAFEFAGERCDGIVKNVIDQLANECSSLK